jgi:hypothetical protein
LDPTLRTCTLRRRVHENLRISSCTCKEEGRKKRVMWRDGLSLILKHHIQIYYNFIKIDFTSKALANNAQMHEINAHNREFIFLL